MFVSFDGNGDGLLGNGAFELINGVGSDILVAGDLEDDLGGVVLADERGLSGVGVVRFGFRTLGDEVSEGVVHKTTIATLVTLEP